MRVPVCRAEFGLLVRYHVPWVHGIRGPKVVEIEEGNEALYPSADRWEIVARGSDDERRGMQKWRRPPGPEARFVPEPYVRQDVRADVVICPRKRGYGSDKNWPHWHRFERLPGVFAAGAPDSSYDVQCPRAWDHARFLDASIEALRSARLCIATDAGLAHLAVLCGTPLLLITYRGLVAPGPVRDADGRVMQPAYWPVRMEEYYHRANHTRSLIETVDGWEYPERVVRRVSELLRVAA